MGATLAGTGLLVAGLLHLLQLPALAPRLAPWPQLAAWPFGFHVWLAELVAYATVVTGGLLHRWGPSWSGHWRSLDAGPRAAALAATLVSIQALLALAFWLTRQHGPETLGGLRAALRQRVEGPALLLVCSALLFLGGAVGFETAQATSGVASAAWHHSDAGHLNLLLEETLETLGMTGAVLVFARRAWSTAVPSAASAARPPCDQTTTGSGSSRMPKRP